jgi:hypothetical protein
MNILAEENFLPVHFTHQNNRTGGMAGAVYGPDRTISKCKSFLSSIDFMVDWQWT